MAKEEFKIKDGVLVKYHGKGGDVVIPEGVTSIGESAFYDCNSLTNITIPEGVNDIGKYAFEYCKNLTSITIPSSVTSIGDWAFEYCKNLTNITIPDSVTSIGNWAFEYCKNLTNITIPESVTSIGNRAFRDCENLTSITIPSNVKSIGKEAFSWCSSLTSIEVDSNNKTYYSENNCLIERETKRLILGCNTSVIPEGVTSIGSYAFSGCRSLETLTIPEGVTSIGDRAFSHCENLTNITIPSSVTSIEDSAFSGCRSLETLIIPESVNSVGYNLFEECYDMYIEYFGKEAIETPRGNTVFAPNVNLNNVFLNKSNYIMEYIENYANYEKQLDPEVNMSYVEYIKKNRHKFFEDITNNKIYFLTKNNILKLDDIDKLLEKTKEKGLVEANAMLLEYKNKNFSAEKREKHLEKTLFEEKIPTLAELKPLWKIEKLESGNYEILSYKGKDSEIEFPYKIGKNVVEKVSLYNSKDNVKKQITKVVIPEGVTSIDDDAFYKCSNLTSIIIPSSVISIGEDGFRGCESLTSITIPSSVTSIGEDAFYGCKKLNISCSAGSYAENYANNNGIKYKNI